MKNFYGLILAGGSGTRLWPISKQYYPKQFLKLFGNKTLIQQTFVRISKLIPPEKIFISTNRMFIDEIVLQLEQFGLCKANILIQPADKNTGPAITQATKKILERDTTATIVTCPADHLINDEAIFMSTLKAGYTIAQKGKLVTFGIKPGSPNSGYGYISIEKQASVKADSHEAFKVKKFIEKPSLEKSALLIKEGSLWNSGIFVWQGVTILKEIKKFDSKIYKGVDDSRKYALLESIPIDKSILEKSDLVWVISAAFDWQDIGSWTALYELLPKDHDNNVLNEWATAIQCNNSLIYGVEGKTLTALGVNDMIIVDTKDDLLISPKQSIPEIKTAIKKVEQYPLITLIIASHNDRKNIESTLQSVFKQNYKNIEIIVADGGSTDGTIEILNKYKYKIEHFLSLPHETYFNRLNKAISGANGEIINIFDANNSYNDSWVIEEVVRTMGHEKTNIAWGDLIYFANNQTNKKSMYWKSSPYVKDNFQKGWTPPFPALFVRRSIYEKYGMFKTKFSVAAEYDLMVRLLEKNKIKGTYIPRILIKMTGKGLTIKNLTDRFVGNLETYRSSKENGLNVSPMFLLSKNINKIKQLFL